MGGGFRKAVRPRIGVRCEHNAVVQVTGSSPDAVIHGDMLTGGALMELGCGFNPKWPRNQIYPAGSNSPGALHFGIDLVRRRTTSGS